jgi:hypothetical protein
VNKYGGRRALSESDAKVKLIYRDGSSRLFRCPTDGIGDWWHVFTLDVSGSLDAGQGILN